MKFNYKVTFKDGSIKDYKMSFVDLIISLADSGYTSESIAQVSCLPLEAQTTLTANNKAAKPEKAMKTYKVTFKDGSKQYYESPNFTELISSLVDSGYTFESIIDVSCV